MKLWRYGRDVMRYRAVDADEPSAARRAGGNVQATSVARPAHSRADTRTSNTPSRARGSRWPLDEQQRFAGDQLAQTQIVDLVRVGDPIEIAVIDAATREPVGLDERVRRTAHRVVVAERAQQSRDERGLAGAELALETDEPRLAVRSCQQRVAELGARRLRRRAASRARARSRASCRVEREVDACAQLVDHVEREQAALAARAPRDLRLPRVRTLRPRRRAADRGIARRCPR